MFAHVKAFALQMTTNIKYEKKKEKKNGRKKKRSTMRNLCMI